MGKSLDEGKIKVRNEELKTFIDKAKPRFRDAASQLGGRFFPVRRVFFGRSCRLSRNASDEYFE